LGGLELLIILAIILLFFGAKRLPEVGRALGRGVQELRKGASQDPDETELDERREGRKPPGREEQEVHPKEESVRRGEK
jgi:sec-independent protein translocase protein TatA